MGFTWCCCFVLVLWSFWIRLMKRVNKNSSSDLTSYKWTGVYCTGWVVIQWKFTNSICLVLWLFPSVIFQSFLSWIYQNISSLPPFLMVLLTVLVWRFWTFAQIGFMDPFWPLFGKLQHLESFTCVKITCLVKCQRSLGI